MTPTGTIRIVMAEDCATDAELAGYALRRAGIDAQLVVTATEAEMRAALREGADIVISDNTMPGFSGLQARTIGLARGGGLARQEGSASTRRSRPQAARRAMTTS